MNIRERLENNEEKILVKGATLAKESLGRKVKEEECSVRTAFMVDRDRIIHCKSFRRLKHKTQVYIKTSSDHYRTRLTHTLEVAQIGRTIGIGIGLNGDLVEAIALGHDLGHVAFAHNGEEVLNELLPNGFRHNVNSIRVVTKLEQLGKGLNLTEEVLDGILHHSGFSKGSAKAFTMEGQIVKYSDKIAYVNHDIDDSIRAGLLKEEEIPRDIKEVLGNTHTERIDTLVKGCIYNTLSNIEKGIFEVSLDPVLEKALSELRTFMFKNIYNGPMLRTERTKAKFVLSQVFEYFMKHPEEMPEFYRGIVEEEGLPQGVADYISGMSDDFCLVLFNKLYVPKFVIY